MFYDRSMRHIEMHVIQTVTDLHLADVSGLDVYEDDRCERCGELVADVDGGAFRPFVVLLDDETEWIVCAQCAEPVL